MDVTVLVSTVDTWSILWEPFAFAWRRFWPDCPWPVLFITNVKNAPLEGALKTGPNPDWTVMTRDALSRVNSETVLFIHEDCWLVHPVNTPMMIDFAGIVERREADVVRMYLSYQADQGGAGSYEPDPRLYRVDPDFPYALNLQASFWNTQVFLSLLKEGETCWSFETTGSWRAKQMGTRILCMDAATVPAEHNDMAGFCYINAACRGHWRLGLGGDTILGDLVVGSTTVPLELRKAIGMA